MTSRWTIALASAAGATIAAVAVITLSGRASDDATATVPDDSVPAAEGSTDDTDERTITVSGRGTVQVVPDLANLSAGVQAQAPTAVEALDTVGTASQELVATLQGVGIAEEDIQTSGLNLYPNYGNDGASINGYQASTNVSVTVRDVERAGEIVDALQGFVGEELTLSGISFSYDDPEAVLGEAREAAVANARVRAEQYAAAAGAEVGEILRIVEGSAPSTIFAASPDFARDEAAQSVAIEPGSQDLAADVTVVFAMS